jgi:uncharacterized lipoprotein YddW (UPF0748 family)
MSLMKVLRLAAAFFAPAFVVGAVGYQPSALVPPGTLREFRGVWVATVGNIDWPSKPGLTTAQQKRELIEILDHTAQLKLNAVLLQVRPACDALYASPIEPWSEYLTGTMGKAPQPFYDPLAFAVEEAHRRGLELHAWFNPYRALHFTSKSQIAPNHVSKTHPDLVRKYGNYLWLDPGEPGVRDYTLSVVMDVVKRYDIDGVHFDDYFYPDRRDSGADSDFPDEASWRKYLASASGARMSREDWRRENVNAFVERVYDSIKAVKPWVKFGISPRGIWRPGYPPQIKGMDAWGNVYADSRKWLANGWLDYFTPQLYWPIESKEQSFGALLKWWSQQNTKGRDLWPGLNATRANQWRPDEIPDQIRRARNQPGITGYVCYNASSLFRNESLSTTLEQEINVQPALVPALSWLHAGAPAKPALYLSGFTRGNLQLWMGKLSQDAQSRWWLLQTRSNGTWTSEILPSTTRVKSFGNEQPDVIALTLINRFGNASPVAVVEKKPPGAASPGARNENGAKK